MKTWPVTSLPKGRQPPGGRLRRSTRLRKKFHKWWIQEIVPPFHIGDAIDQMVLLSKGAAWDVVGRAMRIMEKEAKPQPYADKLVDFMKVSMAKEREEYRARPSRAKMTRSK
jgi:hypothetical protein